MATSIEHVKKAMNLEQGMKFDGDKPPMELLDRKALEGTARVLGFGAQKYDRHNWRKGIAYSRLIGAAMRHLTAIADGEDLDPESGLPHADHLQCCAMFLSNMMKTRPDMDDRHVTEEAKDQLRRTLDLFDPAPQTG